MYEDENKPQFQSNLFKFKRKKANKVASLCLVFGLAIGFTLGIILCFTQDTSSWYRTIPFATVGGGLLGLLTGFIAGTKIDSKKKR